MNVCVLDAVAVLTCMTDWYMYINVCMHVSMCLYVCKYDVYT
jgi:hypothetical protein